MKIHIVKEGESLYLIGQKYGVTVDELKKLNPSATDDKNLQIGAKIKVPSAGEKPGGLIHKYSVKSGDTLWKLSKAWGVPLSELIKANPQLTNPDALQVGDTVNIPKQKQSQAASPEHKAEHHDHAGGKTFTGPIVDGKKNTAPIVEEKPVVPPSPAPVVPSVPPVPPIPPVAEKIYGKEKPYGEKAVHPFAQEKLPAVEASAPLYEMPKMPEHKPSTGYGSGYGQELPGIGGQMMSSPGGYGAWPMGTSPAAVAPVDGYAQAAPWAGGHMGGGYGYGGQPQPYAYPGAVEGAGLGQDDCNPMTGAGGYDGYGMPAQGQGYASGYGQPAYGAPGYHEQGYAGQGYGHQGYAGHGYGGYGHEMQGYGDHGGYGGYGVDPYAQGQQVAGMQTHGSLSAYNYDGNGKWNAGINGGVQGADWPGYQPQAYAGAQQGYQSPQAYAGAQQGYQSPQGYAGAQQGYQSPQAYAGAQQGYYSPGAWPQQAAAVHGYGGYSGYSGAQPQEAAPIAVQPGCCGERDGEQEAAAVADEAAKTNPAKAKPEAKQAKTGTAAARKQGKKAVIRSAPRPAPRRSKGSKPWINR